MAARKTVRKKKPQEPKISDDTLAVFINLAGQTTTGIDDQSLQRAIAINKAAKELQAVLVFRHPQQAPPQEPETEE